MILDDPLANILILLEPLLKFSWSWSSLYSSSLTSDSILHSNGYASSSLLISISASGFVEILKIKWNFIN